MAAGRCMSTGRGQTPPARATSAQRSRTPRSSGRARPRLYWQLSVSAPFLLALLNAVSARLPLSTWRPRPLVAVREMIARRLLGMGDVHLSGTLPAGQRRTMTPQRIYLIDDSSACFAGEDLGAPTRLEEAPRLGELAFRPGRRSRSAKHTCRSTTPP